MLYLKHGKFRGDSVLLKIKLNKLNTIIESFESKNMLDSTVPTNIVDWINNQLDYHSKNSNTLGYELLLLATRYSLTPFNAYINNTNMKLKFTMDQFGYEPSYLLQQFTNYINNSPLPQTEFVVYSGISSTDYHDNMNDTEWISSRFRSSTFDKYHALTYAVSARNDKIYEHDCPYYLLKIIVTPESHCLYTICENQVMFPPNTIFRFISKDHITSKYKDISNNEFSSEKYDLCEITYKTIPNSDNIDFYRMQNAHLKQHVGGYDKEKIYCEPNINNIALLLFRKIKNSNEYESLFLSRTGDKKLMTIGGNVDMSDVYDDNTKVSHACFKGLIREYKEETGYKLPRIHITGKYIFEKHTKIYIAETYDYNIQFKPTNETLEMIWINTKQFDNLDNIYLVKYVKRSLQQMINNQLLSKYI